MHCWRTLRATMKAKVDALNHAGEGAGTVVKSILGMEPKQTEKASDAGDNASHGKDEQPLEQAAGEAAGDAKVKKEPLVAEGKPPRHDKARDGKIKSEDLEVSTRLR